MFKKTLLLLVIPAIAIAQTDLEKCIAENKADAMLRIGEKGYVFETYEKWEEEDNHISLLDRQFKWAFRDGYGNLLNDAELLEKVGQETAAERMREIYRSKRINGNVRLFVGAPLGVALSVAGALWMVNNFDNNEPSTLDQAGAVVLSISGVGVTTTAILSYIGSRKVDPHEHDITGRQAIDVLDRHNTVLESRCRSGK